MNIPLLKQVFMIAAGASCGALLRYLCLSLYTEALILINLLGSVIMGFSFAYFKNDFTLFFLNIGLLGSFTTFSSFSLQALKYMQAGLWDKMLYFIIFSVLSGIIGCYIGYRLGSKLT